MEFAIGIILAAAVCTFALLTGLDRERAFYSTVLIVIATYYILFAAMGGSRFALTMESLVAVGFAVLAVAGFKRNFWLVAGGLAGHGIFDFFHHRLIQNAGVPAWWPGFCMSWDVFAGIFLAVLLARRSESGRMVSGQPK